MGVRSVGSLFCVILLSIVVACSHGRTDHEVDLGAGFNQASGSGFDAPPQVVTPANDGSGAVYVGGAFTAYNGTAANRIVRLNANGTIDTGFSIGSGFNSSVMTVVPVNDGSSRIYVGGSFTAYDSASANRLVRLNADGTPDTGFSIGTGFDGMVASIAPTRDGSGDVYVAGGFTLYNGSVANRIVRLKANGTADTAFVTGSGFGGSIPPGVVVWSIALANDGSGDVYVGGIFASYNGTSTNCILRLNHDGTLDTDFNLTGGFINASFGNIVFSIAPANDGSGDVYVGGLFLGTNNIVRLNASGSIDFGFAIGFAFDNIVFSIAPAADGSGDVYVGGTFTAYNGTAVNRFARLHADGAIGTGFSMGNGFDEYVQSAAPANDGSGDVFVVGGFTAYNGTAAKRVVRLDLDGTVD